MFTIWISALWSSTGKVATHASASENLADELFIVCKVVKGAVLGKLNRMDADGLAASERGRARRGKKEMGGCFGGLSNNSKIVARNGEGGAVDG